MSATHELLWSRCHDDGERFSHDGRYLQAEAAFEAALGHARAARIEDARLAATFFQLALLAQRSGRVARALELYERARTTEERALGPDHPYVALIRHAQTALARRACAVRPPRRSVLSPEAAVA